MSDKVKPMGLPALQEAFDIIQSPPLQMRVPAGAFDHFREQIARDTDEFITRLNQWRFRLISSMNALPSIIKVGQRSGEDRAAIVEDLEKLRSILAEAIDYHHKLIDEKRAEVESLSSELSKYSVQDARFARKQYRRVEDALIANNDARERFRLAALFAIADIDPGAKGGPIFTDAKALIRHLRASVD